MNIQVRKAVKSSHRIDGEGGFDQTEDTQNPSAGLVKPHIAFLLQGLGAGGSERIVSLLCNHFASKGWRVTLFAFESEESTPYYDHHPSVHIVQLGLKPTKLNRIAGVTAALTRIMTLRKALKLSQADILVSFLTRTNIYAVFASQKLEIPVIISERNNPAVQKVGPVWNCLRRIAYPRATGLITMTQGAMEYFAPAMRKQSWVIPNPVTVKPVALPTDKKRHQITAVGRLVPQKGFDLLIAAFAKIADQNPGWTLVIWGDGPDREKLEQQRDRLRLNQRVELPGVTEQPGAWIAETGVFVLSSRFEGWGLVLSEAMASGLPVVSFNCEWGPAEMIDHRENGLLVDLGDVDALAAIISQLCGDPDLRLILGSRARESMQRFSINKILAMWEDVIVDILEKKHGQNS